MAVRRRAWVIGALLAVIASVAVVVAVRGHGHRTPPGPPGTYSMIEGDALGSLQSNGLSASVVRQLFDTSNGLVISHGVAGANATTDVDDLPSSSAVRSFTSYATLQRAFATGAVPSSTRYILYDNEHWGLTPVDEQQDPIGYEQKVAALVHRHGLKLIFTPAADLTSVLGGGGTANKYAGYLSLGLAAQGAKDADVFEIQAQQAEGTSGFRSFVTSAARQVHDANPDCVVLVGIGSNPAGRTVTAKTILDDYLGVRSDVNGFWFNLPATNPEPDVAVDFFRMLLAAEQS